MTTRLPRVVADASAVLAFVRRERGADVVARLLPRLSVSSVNWTEILQRAPESGTDASSLAARLLETGIQVVSFDQGLAEEAARLRAPTRSRGLALGDRACLALGLSTGLAVITADRAWLDLDLGVRVAMIR